VFDCALVVIIELVFEMIIIIVFIQVLDE
jgi:hypothetical protein